MELRGKRIIVTGGITGIGKATVLQMVSEGATVVTMSRAEPSEQRAATVIDMAKQLGDGPVSHIQCDVTRPEKVKAAFATAIEFMGGLDVLVQCAGLEHEGLTEDLPEEALLEQLTLHVGGTAYTNAAACKHFKTVGGGVIVNMASLAGAYGMPEMAAYSAAKGGVLSYARTIAKEWAPYNIRSNVVIPAVSTELTDYWLNDMDADRRAVVEAWFEATISLGGKLGNVDDAAHLIVFLASDKAAFIHGQTIGVDGGMFQGR